MATIPNIARLRASIRAAMFPRETKQTYAAPQVDRSRRASYQLKRNSRPRIDLEIEGYEYALRYAMSQENPHRRMLYLYYEQAMEDEQITKETRIWMERILAERTVMIDTNRAVGDRFVSEGVNLITKSWFYQFCRYAMEAWLWGHSLIEFDTRMVDGQFVRCDLVPREHVRPEWGDIVVRVGDSKGLPYRSGPLSRLPIIEVGMERDLGLLKVLCRSVIKKRYSQTDWLRRNEKYGTPYLVVRTTTDDNAELDRIEQMAAGFGSNAYAILDSEDQIDFKESNQAFAYQTFRDFNALMDDYISKTINGAVLGENSGEGSRAKEQVSERTKDAIGNATMRWLEFLVNDELFPMLRRFGYDLPENLRFEFYALTEEADQEDREARMGGAARGEDEGQASTTSEELRRQKKKPRLNWPEWPRPA